MDSSAISFLVYVILSLLYKNKISMTFNVQIKVMPLKELLDPQGKAVQAACKI